MYPEEWVGMINTLEVNMTGIELQIKPRRTNTLQERRLIMGSILKSI